MSPGQQFYQTLDEELAGTIAGASGFAEHVQTAPVGLPENAFAQRTARLHAIRSFFRVTLQIFRDVVAGKHSSDLAKLLLNDVPKNCGIEFHRELPNEVWTIPVFFRTDEAKDGRIFEIQCPGSGWGDLQLLLNAYARRGPSSVAISGYQPSRFVAEEVVRLCGKTDPSVLHLLDNASNPVSMRYLMATTQPPLRYWGYEKSVRNAECNFVRSHSFFGLVAENLFKSRIRGAAEGRVNFDLPPVLVFDQKIPLCLPFLAETKSLFTDSIREILAYSHPVTENGFMDVNGEWVTCESFINRPASQRRYFLKYAGCDVSVNWGSRSVYRLSDSKAVASNLLKVATEDARQGRFWLIQPEISHKEMIIFFGKKDGTEIQAKWTAKYSCFYGPTRLIGIRTMHRNHPKVHGQEETVVGIAVPGYRQEPAPFEDSDVVRGK